MQFRLSELFTITTIFGVLAAIAAFVIRHWDLRAAYRGYYGPDGVPDWATGTGQDRWAEAFGGLAHAGMDHAPWIILMAFCCFGAAIVVHVKGGGR